MRRSRTLRLPAERYADRYRRSSARPRITRGQRPRTQPWRISASAPRRTRHSSHTMPKRSQLMLLPPCVVWAQHASRPRPRRPCSRRPSPAPFRRPSPIRSGPPPSPCCLRRRPSPIRSGPPPSPCCLRRSSPRIHAGPPRAPRQCSAAAPTSMPPRRGHGQHTARRASETFHRPGHSPSRPQCTERSFDAASSLAARHA
mmetsp:Transcript_132244/g.411053  ORF Transcript_132244/g.411053 Transcript_132244/m.411053 type:complete len:200 (+) Transcript_132244:517-1116(+)